MSAKLECYLCDIQTGLLTWTEGYGGVYLCQPCKVKMECSYCGATEELIECRICLQPICEDCVKHYEVNPGECRYYCEQCYVHPPCVSCFKSIDDPENEMEKCETCYKRQGDEFVAYLNRAYPAPSNPFDDDKLWDDAVWAGVQNDDNKRKAIETAARIQALLRNEHSQDALETACRALASIESVMNKE